MNVSTYYILGRYDIVISTRSQGFVKNKNAINRHQLYERMAGKKK